MRDPEADAKWAKISAKHRLSFLIGPYERRVYWYEVVECFRRISLSGLLVIFGAGSTRQIVVATFLALFYIRVGAFYNAQRADEDDMLAEMCNWQLFFILYICLLIRVGAAPEDVGAILLFILVVSFGAVLFVMLILGGVKIRASCSTYVNENWAGRSSKEGKLDRFLLCLTKDNGESSKEDAIAEVELGNAKARASSIVLNDNPLLMNEEKSANDAMNFSAGLLVTKLTSNMQWVERLLTLNEEERVLKMYVNC